jgi:hypothetical protein
MIALNDEKMSCGASSITAYEEGVETYPTRVFNAHI